MKMHVQVVSTFREPRQWQLLLSLYKFIVGICSSWSQPLDY